MDLDFASTHFENIALRLETEPFVYGGGQHLSRLRRDDLDLSSAFVPVPLFARSVGGDRVYGFVTYELGPNSIFVICANLQRYPFRLGSTLLECVLKLNMPDTQEPFYFSFLGKLERVYDSHDTQDEGPAGYTVKILQANFDDRKRYDLFDEFQKGLARRDVQ